jgi:hypothetical protein
MPVCPRFGPFGLHDDDGWQWELERRRAERVDPRTFAKVAGVRTPDGRTALLVLDAPDRVDLAKARRVLDASDVRLLTGTYRWSERPSTRRSDGSASATAGLPRRVVDKAEAGRSHRK